MCCHRRMGTFFLSRALRPSVTGTVNASAASSPAVLPAQPAQARKPVSATAAVVTLQPPQSATHTPAAGAGDVARCSSLPSSAVLAGLTASLNKIVPRLTAQQGTSDQQRQAPGTTHNPLYAQLSDGTAQYSQLLSHVEQSRLSRPQQQEQLLLQQPVPRDQPLVRQQMSDIQSASCSYCPPVPANPSASAPQLVMAGAALSSGVPEESVVIQLRCVLPFVFDLPLTVSALASYATSASHQMHSCHAVCATQ